MGGILNGYKFRKVELATKAEEMRTQKEKS